MNELRSCPIITCPACGSIDVHGNYDIHTNEWTIWCTRCGIEVAVPAGDMTDLEGACAVVNASEKLKYEVEKSKKEARDISKGISLVERSPEDANTIIHIVKGDSMNKNKKLINTADEGVRPFIRTSEDVYNEMSKVKKRVLYYLVGVTFERKKNGESIDPKEVIVAESKNCVVPLLDIIREYTDEEYTFLEEMLERVKDGELKEDEETKTEEK